MGAALLAYYPNLADDYDVWWHLQYGRLFVQQFSGSIDHSQFSWTPADADWNYVTWIGSSVLYLVHAGAGFPGLTALQWLIFGGIAALFVCFLRRGNIALSALHWTALLWVGIALNPIAAYVKPELFTLLLFAGVVTIYLVSKLAARNLFLLYPGIFLVWVNTHGAFAVGLVFISAALLFETVAYGCKRSGRLPRGALLGFAAGVVLSYAAVTVNPHGWRYLAQIAAQSFQGDSNIRQVSAYFPVWSFLTPDNFPFRKFNCAWAMVAMAAWLAWLFMYGAYRRRHVDWPLAALNALFFVFGFAMLRASIYFCILWLFSWPYLAMVNQIAFQRWHRRAARVISALIIGMLAYEVLCLNTYDSWFGSKIRDFVPAEETEFIRANRLPPPLFNDYLTGGYLIWSLWPEYKVFIDPRYGPYRKTGVWKDYLALADSNQADALAALEKKYAFNSAIIHVASHPALIDLFLAAPGWELVFFGKTAAVFVRTAAAKAHGRYQADMQPARFDSVTNPKILFALFYLYCNYAPSDAAYIYRLYERNVSRLYAGRPYHLHRMRSILASIRQEK